MKTLINATLITLSVGSLAAQSPTPASTGSTSTTVINACYLPSSGTLWVIGLPGLDTDCRGAKKNGKDAGNPIFWNQAGPKGDPGPAGASVTSSALAVGDPVCPNGGSKFVVAATITYACNGKDGTSPIVNVSVTPAPNSVVQRDASGGIQVGSSGLQMTDGTALKSLNDVTLVAAKKLGDVTTDFSAANLHTTSVMFADGTKQTTAPTAVTGVVAPTPNTLVERDPNGAVQAAGLQLGTAGVSFNDGTQLHSMNDVLTLTAAKNGDAAVDFSARILNVGSLNFGTAGMINVGADTHATPNTLVQRDPQGAVTATSFFGTLVQPSDVNLKSNFSPVDAESVLDRIAHLSITEWAYRADPHVRHIGPMAQDFRAAFGLGIDDKSITTIDEGGVSLAAIQALARRSDDLAAENRALHVAIDELTARLSALEAARKQ